MFYNINQSPSNVELKSQQIPQKPRTGRLYLLTAEVSLVHYENYRTVLIYNDEGIWNWKDWKWIIHSNNIYLFLM
ncbi:MAG: hypothetical protein M5E90_05615 [Asgard group archaeon]|nr:hypothetical protein [Asgard group archaeon]